MAVDKVQETEKLIARLKTIAKESARSGNYNKALSALSACANVLYEYNQRYKDDEIEEMLLKLGQLLVPVPEDFMPKDTHPVQTVLYYDGFGLDLRGLAASAAQTIASLGYRLVYVTKAKARNAQPHIKQALKNFNVEYVYVDMDSSYVLWAEQLNRAFQEYAPQVAYFYSTPYDVSGAMVFSRYKGRVFRFLSNLTDHAFWVGLNAFDYCSAGRAMGAYISIYERGIPIEKLYNNKSTLFVNENALESPLPFDTQKYRYVFSGGALYKTLGDSDKLFYKIIEHIITHFSDVNFVYAGEGDRTEFEKLIQRYPSRVVLFHERDDFYQIMLGSVFFLNTYPMFGGQMMRYAALAEKLPITLRHNDDGQGILMHQEELEIEFESYDEVIDEIDRVLSDEEYRKKKEQNLHRAVVTKEQAARYYRQMIEERTSPLPVTVRKYDTTQFRNEYLNRLDYRKIQELSIPKIINYPLLPAYPLVFVRRALSKVMERIQRSIGKG